MKEILFVAPTENVYKNAMEMKRIYNFGNIDIIKGILAEGLEAAKAYCKKHSPEILISRGGTYSMLRDAIPLPIVEIKVSASDCIAAYREDVYKRQGSCSATRTRFDKNTASSTS